MGVASFELNEVEKEVINVYFESTLLQSQNLPLLSEIMTNL